ncbi:LysR family transcriptional regulator [Leisingera sp. SS27]|uniref:LysR family transcriptional regulator n=1 Tax=Leisingera sp. SS27 TaxID=2979462 RepID=UPI00232D6756|nr:LysR family transcriptional regulator [Leisingera sp. SS27]MDC0660545.1 LysR family transcriptional regulator [Leisingera sp. SS27]
MDISSQMISFVKVVDLGSISAASRSNGQTPSAISKQIRQLEDHVGCRLLHRTQTGVYVTDEGREFYEKCSAMAEKFFEAEAHIHHIDTHPKGVLRVASSVAFGKSQLIPFLPKFLDEFRDVTVMLELTDRKVELEEENFDVAVNLSEQFVNPDFITKRIMKNERILCASPIYLERYGMPEEFSDLANCNCLRTSNVVERNDWQAEFDGKKYSVEATGNFEGNSADAVYVAVLAGLGIARLSEYLVSEKLFSGELVRLFPEYIHDHADVAVTFAEKRNLAPKIRAFVDFLVERLDGSRGE